MFGMRGGGSRGPAARASSSSPSRTCSAIAIEADSPVERIPPTQA